MRDSRASEPAVQQIDLARSRESYSRLNRSGKTRQKQWAPKVKSGCITCKIRRIKCDETKPSCRRCSFTGRKCDGYNLVSQKPTSKALEVMPMPSAWELLSGDHLEIKSFQFFHSVTIPTLTGFFDRGRWARRLLQMSHQYPALWHAMTAVAGAHRDFMTDRTPTTVSRSQDSVEVRFILRQWNTSIQSLQELLSGKVLTKLDRLVILSVCLLFATLASLQGRQWQAFVHINSGLKLLHQWNLADIAGYQSDKDLDLNMLFVLFSQLDSQARPYRLNNLQWTDKQLILPSSTAPFQSLLEACLELEVHFSNMMQLFSNASLYIHGPNPETQSEIQNCINDFAGWDNKLTQLLATTLQPENRKALNILYIRRALARIALTMDLSKGELAHDEFTQDYARILHLIGPTIRQQAIRLLRQYPGREGICEGMAALKIVERVVEIEEECLTSAGGGCTHGQWICVNHRVTLIQFSLLHERQVKTVMHTGEDLLQGRPGRELVITYW
ncbi:hypothetical protein ASPCADRAFT_211411 [Aspergillus carbonarius ITEM 5010]|uniref:Zn(2)-C6 fungal-type domain-containing protein n=1 Tax=Aspergillus carbonarius (strain ITEM 5010) TaxID=602072 RepID=A0A1R3R9H9_ASPC5|nr:hypothetical protein ASPCADRAFT_211411 [Aspergillus carbonarius ITEM 5010]